MNLSHYLIVGIGLIGVLIIVWGVIKGLIGFLSMEYNLSKGLDETTEIGVLRRNLGSYLLLGLEFLIAADIVYTILEPNMDEVIILAFIVAIRTVLTYSLDKEVSEGKVIKNLDKDRVCNKQ